MELEEPYGQILIGLSALVLFVSAVSWSRIIQCLRHREPVIPMAARRAVPWGLAAVLLFIMSLMVAVLMVQGLATALTAAMELDAVARRLVAMAAFSIGSLIATLLCLAVVWRLGATDADLGGWPAFGDLKLAILAFGALAPMVYAIQAILSKLWKSSEHPIIELVGKNPSTLFFVTLSLSAVVVAPLAEEFFFRLLLQGWFENLAATPRNEDPQKRQRIWWGQGVVPMAPKGVDDEAAHADTLEPTDALHAADHPEGASPGLPGPLWPVWTSSLLFALAHAGYGPDPIPLFVLALALGFLYRRTHRIWPCVILHMLVNATSMIMLWAMVRGGADF